MRQHFSRQVGNAAHPVMAIAQRKRRGWGIELAERKAEIAARHCDRGRPLRHRVEAVKLHLHAEATQHLGQQVLHLLRSGGASGESVRDDLGDIGDREPVDPGLEAKLANAGPIAIGQHFKPLERIAGIEIAVERVCGTRLHPAAKSDLRDRELLDIRLTGDRQPTQPHLALRLATGFEKCPGQPWNDHAGRLLDLHRDHLLDLCRPSGQTRQIEIAVLCADPRTAQPGHLLTEAVALLPARQRHLERSAPAALPVLFELHGRGEAGEGARTECQRIVVEQHRAMAQTKRCIQIFQRTDAIDAQADAFDRHRETRTNVEHGVEVVLDLTPGRCKLANVVAGLIAEHRSRRQCQRYGPERARIVLGGGGHPEHRQIDRVPARTEQAIGQIRKRQGGAQHPVVRFGQLQRPAAVNAGRPPKVLLETAGDGCGRGRQWRGSVQLAVAIGAHQPQAARVIALAGCTASDRHGTIALQHHRLERVLLLATKHLDPAHAAVRTHPRDPAIITEGITHHPDVPVLTNLHAKEVVHHRLAVKTQIDDLFLHLGAVCIELAPPQQRFVQVAPRDQGAPAGQGQHRSGCTAAGLTISAFPFDLTLPVQTGYPGAPLGGVGLASDHPAGVCRAGGEEDVAALEGNPPCLAPVCGHTQRQSAWIALLIEHLPNCDRIRAGLAGKGIDPLFPHLARPGRIAGTGPQHLSLRAERDHESGATTAKAASEQIPVPQWGDGLHIEVELARQRARP